MLRASGRSAAEGVAAIITNTNWGGRRVAPLHFTHAPKPARANPILNIGDQAMTDTTVSTIELIRTLNDDFRRTFVGGAVVITAGVEAMPAEQRRSLLAKVRAFDAFTEDNDPHGEHDFGAIDESGVRCFWKIDLYEMVKVKRYFAEPFCFSPSPDRRRSFRCT